MKNAIPLITAPMDSVFQDSLPDRTTGLFVMIAGIKPAAAFIGLKFWITGFEQDRVFFFRC